MMDAERWKQLEQLFDELVDAPAGLRESRLAELPPALAGEVAGLLAQHDRGEPLAFEARLAAWRASASALDSPLFAAGHSVGPYELIAPLGQGGMGEVWLAERDEAGFRRKVAIKRVRQGIASSELQQRFRVEQQALARLAHRSIARLLDGGIADGTPYLVLEYVDGAPITRACDERRLSVDERLELFEEICRAVAFAHANLVVHRDIKPSNLLLTPEGEVRLLDFGIAKLLAEGAGGEGLPETRTEQALATPEYASPEQISGAAISTATDVHALGALLYELLVGRRAFREHESTPHALASAILEVDPSPPSVAALDDESGEAVARAAARRSTPRELARRLRGDLDTIVATAMRKDPARRYPSVERLGEDVARFRAGRTIRARPESMPYRLRKFVARNRIGVGIAAAAVAALALLGAQTIRQRDSARRERDAAREVTEFLVSLFEADPYATAEQASSDTPLGAFLASSEAAVRTRLAERPELRARLLMLLGRLHANLGETGQARRLAEESVAERRRLLGARSLEVAESLNILGTALQEEGEYDAAEPVFREALAIREEKLGRRDPATIESVNNLSVLLGGRRRPEDVAEAEGLARRALAGYRELYGDRHLDTAQAANNLAVLLYFRRGPGDLEAAEKLAGETLAIRRGLLGADHPWVATTTSNLANMRLALGDDAGAEALFREAIRGWTASLGPLHPRLVRGYLGLSKALESEGQRVEALAAARRAVEIAEQSLPAEHPSRTESAARVAELERASGSGAARDEGRR